MGYIKVDLELLEEIGDFRQCGIICFLLNQSSKIQDVKTQKWQQTTLAKLFKCERRAIGRDLQKLQANGWLKYEESNYLQLRTTEITLTEKALAYKVDEQHTIEEKKTAKAKKHDISNVSTQHTQPSQLSNKQKHLLRIKQMMAKEEINN